MSITPLVEPFKRDVTALLTSSRVVVSLGYSRTLRTPPVTRPERLSLSAISSANVSAILTPYFLTFFISSAIRASNSASLRFEYLVAGVTDNGILGVNPDRPFLSRA